tara:strand:+ start:1219 stop:1857 length:639 start_codon:yes stop_codon:yes gene_type:complete
MTTEIIIKIFVVIIILFTFSFILLNIYFDVKNYINPKKGIVAENFINVRMRTFEDNSFKSIILPNVDDYDLEMAIPVDQKLHATVQGNWGFNQDENGEGFSTGVYRDGYTADGSVFKGISEKRYKFMLDQGPYVIRYENRKNKKNKYDIRVFINNKEAVFVENEGVPSGKIKYIGTNETLLNKETDSNSEGRRKIDYLKFIPKSNLIEKVKK